MDLFNTDAPLINKFQSISDWTQEWFGITNFQITRLCGPLCLIFLSSSIIYDVTVKNKLFLVIFGIIFILSAIKEKKDIEEAAKYCKKNPEQQNPLIVNFYHQISRSLGLFAFILSVPSIMTYLWMAITTQELTIFIDLIFGIIFFVSMILYFLFLYFGACTPKPHKTSRVKKFAKSLIAKIQTNKSLSPA